jgi:hypothetical protein
MGLLGPRDTTGCRCWLWRTLALNLLRCNGSRWMRSSLMAVAHDISQMLG